jgi:hypothetical protein
VYQRDEKTKTLGKRDGPTEISQQRNNLIEISEMYTKKTNKIKQHQSPLFFLGKKRDKVPYILPKNRI